MKKECFVTRGSFISYVFDIAKNNLSATVALALGITMVCIGVMMGPALLDGVPSGSYTRSRIYYAYCALTAFGFIGITAMVRHKTNVCVGVMMIGISVYMIFLTAVSFKDMDEDLRQFVRFLFYVIEGFCIVFSIGLMLGLTHNSMRLSTVLGIYLCRYLFVIILDWHHGMSLESSIDAHSAYYGPMILLVVAIVSLNLGDTKYTGSMKRLKKNIASLEATSIVDEMSYIMRADLYKLTSDCSQWSDTQIRGLEKEVRIIVFGYSQETLLVLRKWEGEDAPVFSITSNFKDLQDFSPMTSPVVHIACHGDRETCDSVRIYGKDGLFVTLAVRDRHIRKYRTMKEVGSMLNPARFFSSSRKTESTEESDLLSESLEQ